MNSVSRVETLKGVGSFCLIVVSSGRLWVGLSGLTSTFWMKTNKVGVGGQNWDGAKASLLRAIDAR